jgi:hypothetical protein
MKTLSAYEILKDALENPNLNWIRVNYAGHAKDGISAAFRKMFGDTLNHVKKSHFFADRLTSSKSTSLLLTMARDTGSRNEDGEFDFRSLALAELSKDTLKGTIRIPEIMVAENFESYRPLDLAGRPIFPAPDDDAAFASGLLELRRLEALKEKMSNKLSGLKKLLKKDGFTDQGGYRIFWKNPEGTSDAIFDGAGNEIKEVSTPTVGYQLHPTAKVDVKFDTKYYTFDKIVELWGELDALKDKIKAKMTALRHYELGIMERLTDVKSPFMIGGMEFTVREMPGSSYAHTAETLAKVESKEYKTGTVPKVKGSWQREKIEVPSTETATQTETVAAN